MKQYYDLIDKLKESLETNPSVNTVNEGDIFHVDLSKETIFPLTNIHVTGVAFNNHYNTYTVSIVCADIVDETKENKKDEIDVFHGANNLQDIYNTQLSVINLVQSSLRRGDLNESNVEIEEESVPTAQPFRDRFENLLAGWAMTININLPNNDISIC